MNRPSPNVRASHGPDGSVLIDVDQGLIFSLNITGSLVWSQIEYGRSPEEIAAEISRQFEIPPQQALDDILALMQALEDRQLLVAH